MLQLPLDEGLKHLNISSQMDGLFCVSKKNVPVVSLIMKVSPRLKKLDRRVNLTGMCGVI